MSERRFKLSGVVSFVSRHSHPFGRRVCEERWEGAFDCGPRRGWAGEVQPIPGSSPPGSRYRFHLRSLAPCVDGRQIALLTETT